MNNLGKPAGVTPSRGRTTVALRRGLQSEPSSALHLPPSELLKALVGDVNSMLDKFIEEQTPNAFIPLQMKQQRRYYRTSEPVLSAPYTVPRGLVSLTLDKATEPKKRPVTIPHTLVSFFETALAGAGEAVSWLDWWLATLSELGDSLPEETRGDFQWLVVSGSKVLEFLGSQTSALSNLTLLRRDSLLADVRLSVPPEELSRLHHAPLPTSSALFPPGHLDTTTASEKARPSTQPDRAAAPSRVGGCLAPHWRQWQAVGAEPWVVSVLRHGYRIPFQDCLPPVARSTVHFPTYPPTRRKPSPSGRRSRT